MARPLATQEIVFDAASALVADGVQPTIVTVQAKIGGGSYTTIKRLLDKWHAERAHLHEAALEVPGVVEEKCAELGRTLWAIAVKEASKETLAAKEDAERQIATAGRELEFAQSEIRRLEEAEVAQNQLLENATSQLSRATADLTEALAKAAKVPDLEARLVAAQAEANTARREATERAVEAGRLAGEAESLRVQLREVTAALVSLKGNATPGAI